MRDWTGLLELLATAALVVRMTVVGFVRRPGGIFSWPMFSHGCSIVVDLTGTKDGVAEQINVFDLFPTGDSLALTTTELQSLCDYLMGRYDSVDGQGHMWYADGETTIEVVAGRVVLPLPD
ncbi:hypothetical protein OV450_0171 [Actinobacteria bacterium OV450]|nr:hypothetical protein OV450_0171 [Actinobacteria bacterium OV450]